MSSAPSGPSTCPTRTLIEAVNSYLKDRCLFGTDYPLVEFGAAVDAWTEAVEPDVRELFFSANAQRCLFGEPR